LQNSERRRHTQLRSATVGRGGPPRDWVRPLEAMIRDCDRSHLHPVRALHLRLAQWSGGAPPWPRPGSRGVRSSCYWAHTGHISGFGRRGGTRSRSHGSALRSGRGANYKLIEFGNPTAAATTLRGPRNHSARHPGRLTSIGRVRPGFTADMPLSSGRTAEQ